MKLLGLQKFLLEQEEFFRNIIEIWQDLLIFTLNKISSGLLDIFFDAFILLPLTMKFKPTIYLTTTGKKIPFGSPAPRVHTPTTGNWRLLDPPRIDAVPYPIPGENYYQPSVLTCEADCTVMKSDHLLAAPLASLLGNCQNNWFSQNTFSSYTVARK